MTTSIYGPSILILILILIPQEQHRIKHSFPEARAPLPCTACVGLHLTVTGKVVHSPVDGHAAVLPAAYDRYADDVPLHYGLSRGHAPRGSTRTRVPATQYIAADAAGSSDPAGYDIDPHSVDRGDAGRLWEVEDPTGSRFASDLRRKRPDGDAGRLWEVEDPTGSRFASDLRRKRPDGDDVMVSIPGAPDADLSVTQYVYDFLNERSAKRSGSNQRLRRPPSYVSAVDAAVDDDDDDAFAFSDVVWRERKDDDDDRSRRETLDDLLRAPSRKRTPRREEEQKRKAVKGSYASSYGENDTKSPVQASTSPLPFDVGLDRDGRLHLYWNVNYDDATVTLQTMVRLDNADLCVLWVDKIGDIHFKDASTEEDGVILLDNQDDCKLIDAQRHHGVTTVTWQRQFDTCDDDDYVIEDGTTHIVYAVGAGPVWTVANGDIHESSTVTGFQRAQLLKNIAPATPVPAGAKTFQITAQQVRVPSSDTTYWCNTQKLPELRDKHHIIKFEGVVQPGNEALVHHMEVFHCKVKPGEHVSAYNGQCHAENLPAQLQSCKEVIGAWAMGAKAMAYPAEAGLAIGGRDFSPYVMIEIHYNNPETRSDWVDSSGIRFYYTDKLRRYDAGVMELGLEYTPKMAIPPHMKHFDIKGDCIMECTRASLPAKGIHVFASQLHTHLTGQRVWTKHSRDGVELAELNRDNHYSTHFQEIRLLKRQVHVLPGGWGIRDEMCVNYVHYYPRVSLEVCKSSIDSDVLQSYFNFMHYYNNDLTSENQTYAENYAAIRWTPLQAALLQQLYTHTELSMQCNRSNGDRFPGDWNQMPPTSISLPYPPVNQSCKRKALPF
ncbi:PREDICTED: dopamine beta-hydroxylase-like [Priapulus caudatus]|uniref:Dopamine beta-hydroxylase-like n=1 Tax=Priapulus caudatus TaxID=37621 RepID=A0ABM1EI92_PRICU|nr:PREDICTED: dopamine beta-hydroxylase-like [Priapulus caudatus]